VFLNRAGGRLSPRAADEIIGEIAAAAGQPAAVRSSRLLPWTCGPCCPQPLWMST
jgi:hypothetical protein